MQRCERCGATRLSWFTPSRYGRQAGVFLCLECRKLNVLTPVRAPRLQQVAGRASLHPEAS
jgi:hypothetical protein